VSAPAGRWSPERAREWYEREPWPCGFNYLPRTAANWTELWQAESFDPATLSQELGWAGEIGFNTLRTNLQYLVWEDDPAGLRARMDRFLGLAERASIRTMLVLFDDCAFSGLEPSLGPQAPPIPGVHNSAAAASPGRRVVRDPARRKDLERYVRDLVGHFRDDARILVWDLYNEPGNEAVFARPVERDRADPLVVHSMSLVEDAFRWAREEQPMQPLTVGVWNPRWVEASARSVELSDLVSFHNYRDLSALRTQVAELRAHARPLLCTEWLARGLGSRIETHLPYFERERIGCYHWGLCNGRTQTHLPWPALAELARREPELWFHDLLHGDGRPYDEGELALFRRLLRRAPEATPQ
jgi:hypothetical protein